VVVLVATGTHRGNTNEELRQMLGDDVLGAVRVVNHDARDPATLTWVGRLGRDVPVWLNSEWLSADVRITTGFVEPHFFAGFSGGPKLVAPGLAGLETTLTLHDASRIGHPDARWGVIDGNPVQDDVRAIAAATGVTFALDVVLDGAQRIVSAFGGDVLPMHAAACAKAGAIAMCPVTGPFDVVITSNGGFPLDQNLYQSVKGMSAAAQVVKPGGMIVCVAECRDGFPAHGAYRSELAAAPSVQALLDAIVSRQRTVADQWQIQIQASIMARARVVVSTSYLSDAQLAEAHLEQTHDVTRTVADAGPQARICALPHGPMTVPYIAPPTHA
jgi:nickel-dependent lactate racemase